MWHAASSRTSTVIHGRYGPVPWKISHRPWSIRSMRCCHGPPSLWWGDRIGPTLSAGQTVIGVPAAARRGGIGEGVLGDDLAHRVALAALGRALRVRLVGFAVLVDDRPAGELVDVGLGDDRGQARRHDDAADRSRRLDAGDDVVARPPDVVGIVVGADVRHVGDAVAAAEDVVEAAGLVEVGGVQREATGGERVHRLEEAVLRSSSTSRTHARTR